MPSTEHFPPPSRPEQRYDAVVARGERLRRRDRTRRALATTGVAAVAVLAIGIGVLAARGGGTTDADPVAPDTTTTTTTTTTPTVAQVTDGLVTTALVEDGALSVDIDDGSVPSSDATLACVHVRVQPEGAGQLPVAVGSACWSSIDGDAATESSLVPANGVEVGCAVAVLRPEDAAPIPAATGPLHRSFRFTLPADLASGTYVAEITGVTGIGDGCPPSLPGEQEDSANAKVTIDVP